MALLMAADFYTNPKTYSIHCVIQIALKGLNMSTSRIAGRNKLIYDLKALKGRHT